MSENRGETVIVLHGLTRTSRSMKGLAGFLSSQGFRTVNLNYPSTAHPIEVLVEKHVAPMVREVVEAGVEPVHFVTHSLGGIVARMLLKKYRPRTLGRVVMIGPPNRGSELVDRLGRLAPFHWINGPAGTQLGTGADSIPNRLGPVDYPVGVIAGTRSLNRIYSILIGGENDGKVSIERSKVEGMADFIALPANHTFMMNHEEVRMQTAHFLRHGLFYR